MTIDRKKGYSLSVEWRGVAWGTLNLLRKQRSVPHRERRLGASPLQSRPSRHRVKTTGDLHTLFPLLLTGQDGGQEAQARPQHRGHRGREARHERAGRGLTEAGANREGDKAPPQRRDRRGRAEIPGRSKRGGQGSCKNLS